MALLDSVGFDLDEIKNPERIKKPHIIIRVFSNLFLILFFSALVFAVINFPAYLLIYRFKTNPQSVSQAAIPKEIEVNQLGDNSLIIPKIGVKTSVNWDTPSGDVMGALSEKIAHLAGSGKPGDNKNIFITGHSSNYWWREGGLNTVFALLPELQEGDEILITSNGKIFRYRVSEKREVSPKKAADYFFSDSEQLTLMTCVPVGTNLRRLLIIAKPISD